MSYRREITILVPTFKRLENIKQCIRYFGSINSEELGIRMIILDASHCEIQQQIEAFIADIPQDRVRLLPFSEAFNMWLRLAAGMQQVETEYVAICGDDDFYFPDGLIECMNFLDYYQDYVAARGSGYYFLDHNLFHFERFPMIPLKRSISANQPIRRVKEWAEFGGNLFYITYRTSEIQMIFTYWEKKFFSLQKMNIQFAECFFYLVILSWGKIGAIHNKFHLRKMTGQEVNLKRESIYDSVLSGRFQGDIDRSWEVYHEIFPETAKDEFLALLRDWVFQMFFLEGTVKEKNLVPETIKKACENSPWWAAVVKDRKHHGGWIEASYDTLNVTGEYKTDTGPQQ